MTGRDDLVDRRPPIRRPTRSRAARPSRHELVNNDRAHSHGDFPASLRIFWMSVGSSGKSFDRGSRGSSVAQ